MPDTLTRDELLALAADVLDIEARAVNALKTRLGDDFVAACELCMNTPGRIPDLAGIVPPKCRPCAGCCSTRNDRRAWLTCFAGRNPETCKGPFTMDEFMAIEDDDEEATQ